MPTTTERARASAQALGNLPQQLAALNGKTVRELQDFHRELLGEPSRSCNRAGLIKKLSWHVQRRASGGLSPRAVERITQLGDELPKRWLKRLSERAPAASAQPFSAPLRPRDPRLPPVGSVLRRRQDGVEHAVTVREDGFEYSGEHFRTLSAVAKRIAGTPWNGFAYFGLQGPRAQARKRKAP